MPDDGTPGCAERVCRTEDGECPVRISDTEVDRRHRCGREGLVFSNSLGQKGHTILALIFYLQNQSLDVVTERIGRGACECKACSQTIILLDNVRQDVSYTIIAVQQELYRENRNNRRQLTWTFRHVP